MASELSPSRKRRLVDDNSDSENVDPNVSSSGASPNKKVRQDTDTVEPLGTSTQRIDTLISQHSADSPPGTSGTVEPSSGNEIFVAWLEAKFGPPTVPSEPKKKTPKSKVPAVPKKRLTKMEKINKMLSDMGVDPEISSFCVKSAIYRGQIKITGDPAELKMVVHEGVASCGHYVEATLEDVLKQPDYISGTGFGLLNVDEREALLNEAGAHEAYEKDLHAMLNKARTVICKEKLPRNYDDFITDEEHERLDEEERGELLKTREEAGRAIRYFEYDEMRDVEPRDCSNGQTRYTVLNLCRSGPAFRDPEFNDWTGHKHCKKCLKGFGQCIYYKDEHCYLCGKHYHMRGKCDCVRTKKDKAKRREIKRLKEADMWEQAEELISGTVYGSIYTDSE